MNSIKESKLFLDITKSCDFNESERELLFNSKYDLIKKEKSLKKRAGFTLIEMVIVVTIIGIISGIAALKYSKAQKIAKLNADYANASVIATAATLCKETVGEGYTDLKTLKEKGYLQNIPKVQSSKTKDFVIEDAKNGEDDEGSIVVKVDGKVFYPKEDVKESKEK